MKYTDTAKELFDEVFDEESKICLIYSTIFFDLEAKFTNKKSRNKIESQLDSIFHKAFSEANNGNVEKAKNETLIYEKYKVFQWCDNKNDFIRIVSSIYQVLEKHKKADAYYPCGEGKIVGIQIHIDY